MGWGGFKMTAAIWMVSMVVERGDIRWNEMKSDCD